MSSRRSDSFSEPETPDNNIIASVPDNVSQGGVSQRSVPSSHVTDSGYVTYNPLVGQIAQPINNNTNQYYGVDDRRNKSFLARGIRKFLSMFSMKKWEPQSNRVVNVLPVHNEPQQKPGFSFKNNSSSSNSNAANNANHVTPPDLHQVVLPRVNPPFLKPQRQEHWGKKTLILDLDETPIGRDPDVTLNLNIQGTQRMIMILFRPGVHEFLQTVAQWYEVVVFTASLPVYADPLLDILDPEKNIFAGRLFRDCCSKVNNTYLKDLNLVGRDLKSTIIIDNSPLAYSLQPENAIPIQTWFNDPEDQELLELLPVISELTRVEDVRDILQPADPNNPSDYHPLSVTPDSSLGSFRRRNQPANNFIHVIKDDSSESNNSSFVRLDPGAPIGEASDIMVPDKYADDA